MSTALDLIRISQGQQEKVEPGGILQDPDKQDWLRTVADMGTERVVNFELAEDYYDGEHNTKLADRAREYLEVNSIRFSENFCETIIDAIAGRLIVEQFTATARGSDTPEESTTDLLNEWWRLNRMDSVSQSVHTMSLILGEYFVMAEWDEGLSMPVYTGNHPKMVRAWYSDDDAERPALVSKRWNSRDVGPANPSGMAIERLNVYFPDRIEKYWKGHQGDRGWDIWIDEGESAWPVPWTTSDGQPLGIPVAHFRNRPLGRTFGKSELRNDIPMQDLQNKMVVDMAMILDNQAWQQRYIVGQSKQNASIENYPGNVWFFPSSEAQVGSFPAENPTGILAAIDQLLQRRARRSSVPLHLISGGDMPSGEAMRSAEAGLVKKAYARMAVLGDAWEDLQRVGLKLGNLSYDYDIRCEWVAPESEIEKARSEAAINWNQVGASKRTLLSRNGFDPDEEADNRAEEAEEDFAKMRSAMGGSGNLPPNFANQRDDVEDDQPPFPDGDTASS